MTVSIHHHCSPIPTAPRQFAPSTFLSYGNRPKVGKPVPENEPARVFRAWRSREWKYVAIEGTAPLLFDMVNDPGEKNNLAGTAEDTERLQDLEGGATDGFSWEAVHEQLSHDRERIRDFEPGRKPSTPNQYMLPDGRVFDAEGALYDARWLHEPHGRGRGGTTIPQRFG